MLLPLPFQVFVLAFTFLLLFLGNFLTTLKVVHTKLQKNKDKVKKLWLPLFPVCIHPCAPSRAGFGTDPAQPQPGDGWAWKDSPVPVFGKGLCQHRLSINASMALQSHSCYLCIFNIKCICFWGFCSVYRAACTCLAKCQWWGKCGIYCNSNSGMIPDTFQFYYLNSGYWIYWGLWTLWVDQ